MNLSGQTGQNYEIAVQQDDPQFLPLDVRRRGQWRALRPSRGHNYRANNMVPRKRDRDEFLKVLDGIHDFRVVGYSETMRLLENWRRISIALIDHAGGVLSDSQYVQPKHPPDKEYGEDGPRYVNYPVASRFRFPKIEHAAMVAAPNRVVGDKSDVTPTTTKSPGFNQRA